MVIITIVKLKPNWGFKRKKKKNLYVFNQIILFNLLDPLLTRKQNLPNFSRLQILQLNRMNRGFNHNIVKPEPGNNPTQITRTPHFAIWVTILFTPNVPAQCRVQILNDPDLPIRFRVRRDPEYLRCALVLVAYTERTRGTGIRVLRGFRFEVSGSFSSSGWEYYPPVVNRIFPDFRAPTLCLCRWWWCHCLRMLRRFVLPWSRC